jgi:glycerophosphoryl diester phosphodiesterase
MPSPLVTSHAACKGHAPENTLAGIRAALKLGADAIEIDLHCTNDGAVVLIHDETVDRTTDGEGAIADLSLRQARTLDAGDGESIPTLQEVLREVNGRALMVLEVKASNIEREVLDVVRKVRALDWCAVHSFKSRVVERVRKLEPKMPCTLLTGGSDEVKDWPKVFSLALERGAQGVAPHHSAVTPELVRAANLRELRLSTWTVNSRADVRRVVAAGVSALTSDFPDRARTWAGSNSRTSRR